MATQTLRHPAFTTRPVPSVGAWHRFWGRVKRRYAGMGGGLFSAQLRSGQDLRLHDAAGWTVACRSGALWITQEADGRDIFLGAGEGYALERPGLALIGACSDALVTLRPPSARSPLSDVASRHSTAMHGGDAREAWLQALYPEGGPWNDPAMYRRSGLL